MSPDVAASCTCPELLRSCLIYINDFGGNLLSESAEVILGPLKAFVQGSRGRDVCASPSMDVWAAAVLAFELLRSPGGMDGPALFASKHEVRGSNCNVSHPHCAQCVILLYAVLNSAVDFR